MRASAAREAGWVLELIVELTLEGSFGDAQIVVSVDGRVQWVYCARMADWSPFAHLDPDVPGLVVGVASGRSIVASASFGSATPGGERLGDDSTFYVASIAKQFTAAAIAWLVLDRAVALDDSVRQWIPELGVGWDPVRLRHLLAHTGGLCDGNAVDDQAGWGVNSTSTTWDRVAIIAETDPESKPGTIHRYSNHGYVLLAAVVERATGHKLGEFARDELFPAAGMTASRFLDVAGTPPVPGWVGGSARVDIQFTCCGDGGLVTSLADLAAWNGWLPASRLAPLMLGDRPSLPNGRIAHDAWGISIRTHRGLRIESHGGSIEGYMASFVRFPSEALTVISLANSDALGVAEFGVRLRLLADSLSTDRLDPTRPPWNETHHDLERP